MAWGKRRDIELLSISKLDYRRVGHFKSFCRKCSCHHPGDSVMSGMLKGCICNPAGRRGECGRYVPTDNLEYLEYAYDIAQEDK